jgi:hypothetical protein
MGLNSYYEMDAASIFEPRLRNREICCFFVSFRRSVATRNPYYSISLRFLPSVENDRRNVVFVYCVIWVK